VSQSIKRSSCPLAASFFLTCRCFCDRVLVHTISRYLSQIQVSKFEKLNMAFGNPDGSLRIENNIPEKSSNLENGTNGTVKPMKTKPILHPKLLVRTKEETPDPEALGLEEEIPGWHGYVEWEKYPERKKKVKEFMKKFEFPSVSLELKTHVFERLEMTERRRLKLRMK